MFVKSFAFRLLAIALLLFGLANPQSTLVTKAEIIGRTIYLNPLLLEIEAALDEKGIDVVARHSFGSPLGERPRVVELSGLSLVQPSDFAWKKWMDEFSSGKAGFIAAFKINSEQTGAATNKQFREGWLHASQEKRIFIAFNSSDTNIANEIRMTLEQFGYSVFTFINPISGAPKYDDAAFTGAFFKEAGYHFVIDSKDARKSPGIWFESLQASALGFPGRAPGPPPPPPFALEDKIGTLDRKVFLDALANRWIVTRNPSTGKIFVHRELIEGALIGLLYVIRVEVDGSCTVYRPNKSASETSYGSRLGSVRPNSDIQVGSCTCL